MLDLKASVGLWRAIGKDKSLNHVSSWPPHQKHVSFQCAWDVQQPQTHQYFLTEWMLMSRYVEGCWGFPHLKIKQNVQFPVFSFRIIDFVSWFLGFKHLSCVQKIFVTCYQWFISWIFIDIDPITKILDFIRRIFIIFRRPSFQKMSNMLLVSEVLRFIKLICSKIFGFSSLFKYPVVSKNKNSWFLGLGDGFRNPEIIEMKVLGSPISQSKSY